MLQNGHGETVPRWPFGAIAVVLALLAALPVLLAAPDRQAVTTGSRRAAPRVDATVPQPVPTAPAPTAPPPTVPPTEPVVTLADEVAAFDASVGPGLEADLAELLDVLRATTSVTDAATFRARARDAAAIATSIVRTLDGATVGKLLSRPVTDVKNALGGLGMVFQALASCQSPTSCSQLVDEGDAAAHRLEAAGQALDALLTSTPS